MTRGSSGAGFTLVEALVALALFAIVAAAALGLQAQALRATRTAESRRAVAAVLRAEVALQRALGGVPGSCSGAVPGGWTCQVQRACVAQGGASCDLRVVTVRLAAEDGASGGTSGTTPPRAITATTAVYQRSVSEPHAGPPLEPLSEPLSEPLLEPLSQPLSGPQAHAGRGFVP